MDYEYEIFFSSEEGEPCPIDGWYPIATDRIKDQSMTLDTDESNHLMN